MDKSIAIERILETENLTDALDDDDANWLLDWGIGRVGDLIAGIEDEDEAGAKVNQLMAVMRSLNGIAGECGNESLQQLAADIQTLRDRYAAAFGAAPILDEAEIARLSAALSSMAPREVMQTLLARLGQPDAEQVKAATLSPLSHATPPEPSPGADLLSGAVSPQAPTPEPPTPSDPPTSDPPTSDPPTSDPPTSDPPEARPRDTRDASPPRRLESFTSFARSSRGRVALPVILLGVVALIAVIVSLLSRPAPARIVATPSSDITLYFTEPTSQSSGGVDDYVVADLDKAHKTIDVASFDFNLPSVVNAVTRAEHRGVAARVVVDETNGSQILKASDAPGKKPFDALDALAGAHVPVVDGGRSSGLMHDKFILIDRSILFVGSWNMSFNDTFRNNNNLLRITNPTLLANYQAKFDEMFVDKRFGAKAKVGAQTQQLTVDGFTTENYFSPTDRVMSKLIALVQGSKKSVHFMAFTYTDAGLAAAMIARAKAGVQFQGVIENRGATQGALPTLYCAKLAVEVDGNPNTMHHKVIILDGQTVITGSFNFMQSADKYNDENLLVLRDPALAALYEQEYARVAAVGKQPTNIICPAA